MILGKENDLLVEDGEEMWESLTQMPWMDMVPAPTESNEVISNSPKRRRSSTANMLDKAGLETLHRKSPRAQSVNKGHQKICRM